MDQVSQVREKIDIVSLISEYVSLKKTGRNFKANCPFHSEKTPSFVVSPERQIWHCFGCGKGGDAFTFLMDYENMEFPEALRTLAKKAGVDIRDFSFAKGEYSKKEKIYDLNKVVARFYNFLLTKHPIGKKALAYLLKERNLSLPLINTYSLGFSPSDNSLSNYLITKKGIKAFDLFEAGISYSRNGKAFDFFKNRIMFPLSDQRGNIVGFSGRSLSDSDMPKYINTKDTVVYHKGSLFFGLDHSREEIKKENQAIVVEGEFDCLSAFKIGIKNVVAIKGTALTENQANLLARFTDKVTLALDQDTAGFEATKRSLSVLEKNGLTITVIPSKGKDPDEAIKSDWVSFKKALKNDVNVYDYLLTSLISENDKETVEGKKKITDELLPLISQIGNEVVKEHYIRKLAGSIDTSFFSLNREIEKIKTEKSKNEIFISKKDRRERREILEEYLLSLIIQNDASELIKSSSKFISLYKFEIPAFAKIIESLKHYFKKHEKLNVKNFSKALPSELVSFFDRSYLLLIPKFEAETKFLKEIEKVEDELLTFYIKQRLNEIGDKIKEKTKDKKTADVKNLQKEFSRLLLLLPKS